MTDIVCLSPGHDLKAYFEKDFARDAPELRLLRPDEVGDPGAIEYALVHAPGPDDFKPFPNLRMLCSWGAGVDALMRHPALPEGVVINRMTDPGQAEMMAAFAIHYVTGWHRGMFRYPADQAAKRWVENDWTPNAAVTVGILGYGKMGAAIGRAARVLGYPVQAWASRARVEDGVEVMSGEDAFDALVREARVLVNVLPLTEATTAILNAELFAKMRDDALLVQLARGAHLVEADMIPALDAGRPAAAALDVFATEPLPQDHPFWTHPKIMVTPDAGSAAMNDGVVRAIMRAIAADRNGEQPEGFVDRARGY